MYNSVKACVKECVKVLGKSSDCGCKTGLTTLSSAIYFVLKINDLSKELGIDTNTGNIKRPRHN